jgi:hypothetical protein
MHVKFNETCFTVGSGVGDKEGADVSGNMVMCMPVRDMAVSVKPVFRVVKLNDKG